MNGAGVQRQVRRERASPRQEVKRKRSSARAPLTRRGKEIASGGPRPEARRVIRDGISADRSPSPPAEFRRREAWLAAGLAMLLLVANLLTARGYPVFVDDDVLLTDPGANLYFGTGFISSAWPGQTKDELFGGNLPLYPLAIAGWMKLFGFGALPLRALTYLAGSV